MTEQQRIERLTVEITPPPRPAPQPTRPWRRRRRASRLYCRLMRVAQPNARAALRSDLN